MSTLGVKTLRSCSYVHEIRNHVHIMGLQNRCKKQLFLWKIGGLRTLASQKNPLPDSQAKKPLDPNTWACARDLVAFTIAMDWNPWTVSEPTKPMGLHSRLHWGHRGHPWEWTERTASSWFVCPHITLRFFYKKMLNKLQIQQLIEQFPNMVVLVMG